MKNGLQSDDLTLVIAWKIGAIDHIASEHQQSVIYKTNFNQTFEFIGQFGRTIRAGDIINYCRTNFNILTNSDNAEPLYNNLYHNRGQKIILESLIVFQYSIFLRRRDGRFMINMPILPWMLFYRINDLMNLFIINK